MNEIVDRWCKLAGILNEQLDKETSKTKKDLHVFDFDDTLGVTTSPTLVAAVEYDGGDPSDISSYKVVTDLKDRISKVVKGIKTPTQAKVNSPGLSGDKVRSSDILDDTQAIVLDTEQYRDWKEKYIPSGNHTRIVISPNIENDIMAAGKKMFDSGQKGEIHVTDFSPSSTIGTNVEPIKAMLQVFQKAEGQGDKTAVVTARKGKTDLDALGGGKIPATNAEDIQDFLADEIGSNADAVFGAADFNPSDPASAKRDLVAYLHDVDVDNIHFYDDDPENAKRVAQLCDQVEGDLAGTELDIYNYEFSKGQKPTTPTFSCTIGETTARLTEVQLRRIIRDVIIEKKCCKEDLDEQDFLEEDDCPDFIKKAFSENYENAALTPKKHKQKVAKLKHTK